MGEHIAHSLRGIDLKRALVLQAPCKVLQGVPTENISKEKYELDIKDKKWRA